MTSALCRILGEVLLLLLAISFTATMSTLLYIIKVSLPTMSWSSSWFSLWRASSGRSPLEDVWSPPTYISCKWAKLITTRSTDHLNGDHYSFVSDHKTTQANSIQLIVLSLNLPMVVRALFGSLPFLVTFVATECFKVNPKTNKQTKQETNNATGPGDLYYPLCLSLFEETPK